MKTHKYTQSDKDYIKCEVDNLLKIVMIEPSNSPWQLQDVKDRGKHIVVDYL